MGRGDRDRERQRDRDRLPLMKSVSPNDVPLRRSLYTSLSLIRVTAPLRTRKRLLSASAEIQITRRVSEGMGLLMCVFLWLVCMRVPLSLPQNHLADHMQSTSSHLSLWRAARSSSPSLSI